MRIVVVLLLLGLASCNAVPSLSEEGLIGQSGWRHQQAIEDANVIMQGMNRARAETEQFAKQP